MANLNSRWGSAIRAIGRARGGQVGDVTLHDVVGVVAQTPMRSGLFYAPHHGARASHGQGARHFWRIVVAGPYLAAPADRTDPASSGFS